MLRSLQIAEAGKTSTVNPTSDCNERSEQQNFGLRISRILKISLNTRQPNQDKSAAKLWRQLAAWVPDMFWNFYLLKIHNIADNSATTKAREKLSTELESLEFKKILDVCLIKIENYKTLLNRMSCIGGCKSLISTGQFLSSQITVTSTWNIVFWNIVYVNTTLDLIVMPDRSFECYLVFLCEPSIIYSWHFRVRFICLVCFQ